MCNDTCAKTTGRAASRRVGIPADVANVAAQFGPESEHLSVRTIQKQQAGVLATTRQCGRCSLVPEAGLLLPELGLKLQQRVNTVVRDDTATNGMKPLKTAAVGPLELLHSPRHVQGKRPNIMRANTAHDESRALQQ